MYFNKKTRILIFLTLSCAILTIFFGFWVGSTSIYTHFFYVPVLLGSLWYGKKSFYIAILLCFVYVISTFGHLNFISLESIERIIVLLLVSFFTGIVCEGKIKTEEMLINANDVLAQSNEKYRSLVEFADDPIYLIDRDYKYLSVNKKFLSRFNLQKNQILGMTFGELHSPEETKEFMEKVDCVFNTGEAVKYEPCSNRLDCWTIRSLSPIKNPDTGEVTTVSAIAKDITERKKMEETLRERTYELGERVKELNCLFASSSLAEKPGISLEEILQGTVELIPPALRYPESTCARMTWDGREFRTKNWGETDCRLTSNIVVQRERIGTLEVGRLEEIPKNEESPFLKEESGLIDVVAERLGKIIARNLAEKEKKNLEAQLRQVQKMETIGSLAGGIAHDFNNILTPIIGYSEITMDYVPEDSVIKNNLEEVLKAAMRAKDLVQQILTFSRQSNQELKPMKIQPIIEEALSLLRASLPATIKINQNIDQECGVVLAEPTQIHQILMNLCTNAYHAMAEKGGVLGVTLRGADLDADDLALNLSLNPGPHLILSVSDTGHGMDRGVAERIFDPYFTTKGPGEGTGIGLSVVLGIVKSYGGDITVYSEAGAGTIFNVYLPRIKTDAVTVETESFQPTLKGNEHILLVDDEEPIVRMVQQMLEHLGYNVTALTSSMEALETFRQHSQEFDLVITDQTMPNLTGAQLAQKLLGIRPNIPIILCTGFSEVLTEERAKAMGIREYVMKPVIKSGISKAIRKALD